MLGSQILEREWFDGPRLGLAERVFNQTQGESEVRTEVPMELYTDSDSLVSNVNGEFDKPNLSS